jgi:hypothetical protein
MAEPLSSNKNSTELPHGRFLKSKSLGGNWVIFAVLCDEGQP